MKFWTPKEAAAVLCVSVDTVYKMIHNGTLKAIRFKSGPNAERWIYRIHPDAVSLLIGISAVLVSAGVITAISGLRELE